MIAGTEFNRERVVLGVVASDELGRCGKDQNVGPVFRSDYGGPGKQFTAFPFPPDADLLDSKKTKFFFQIV